MQLVVIKNMVRGDYLSDDAMIGPLDHDTSSGFSCASNIGLVALQVAISVLFLSFGSIGLSLSFTFNLIANNFKLANLIVQVFIFLLSINLFLLGLALVLATLHTMTQTLGLNAFGLSVRRVLSLKHCRWSDLKTVRRSSLDVHSKNFLGLAALYDVASIEFENGVLVRMGPASKFRRRLISIAERKILKARRANVLLEIGRGARIDFNSVVLSLTGLHRGERTICWDSIDRIAVCGGESIVIHSLSGLRFSLTVAKTFNPNLLLSIVDQKWGGGSCS